MDVTCIALVDATVCVLATAAAIACANKEAASHNVTTSLDFYLYLYS